MKKLIKIKQIDHLIKTLQIQHNYTNQIKLSHEKESQRINLKLENLIVEINKQPVTGRSK